MNHKSWTEYVKSIAEEFQLSAEITNILISCDIYLTFCNWELQQFQLVENNVSLPYISSKSDTHSHYLPIEFLRQRSNGLFVGNKVERTFLSSGTTDKNRSQSNFSKQGLKLYKLQSLCNFFSILKCLFGSNFWQCKFFSFVPKAEEWPQSSLAQMVEWIGEYIELQYVTGDEFAAINFDQNLKSPCLLFGTAFHFVNFIDDHIKIQLPENFYLFETGGTKGKSREITRENFYQELSDFFGIKQQKIVSEYGMCELAAQAYDFTLEPDITLSDRSFRFPPWVKTTVATGANQFKSIGNGALSINDPLRIDYPWILRTQDKAQLNDNQSFRILGRIKGTVLKGCSLNAEAIVETKSEPKLIKRFPIKKTKLDLSEFSYQFHHFLKSPKVAESLLKEFEYQSIVDKIIEDTLQSIPKNSSEWASITAKNSSNDSALIVLPRNHSIAGLYPIVMGVLSHINLSIRIPKNLGSENSFLNLLISFLGSHTSQKINVVDDEFRINKENSEDFDQIIIFGEDTTIETIRRFYQGYLNGFGSYLGIAIIDQVSKKIAKEIFEDFYSLGQKGCLSTRAVLCKNLTQKDLNQLRVFLLDEFHKKFSTGLSLHHSLHLDIEEFRYNQMLLQSHTREHTDIYIPILNLQASSPDELISSTPWVLPLIKIEDELVFIKSLETKCIIGSNIKNSKWISLGQISKYKWNGFYQGNKFFV